MGTKTNLAYINSRALASEGVSAMLGVNVDTDRVVRVLPFGINAADWGVGEDTTSALNSSRLQAAITYASARGMAVYIYGNVELDISAPIIMPSNTALIGNSTTNITVDPDTLTTELAFPLAGGGIFMTGDPATGYRAGQPDVAAVDQVIGTRDPDTYVSNIHIEGLNIDASAISSNLASNQELGAIYIFCALGARVINCHIKGTPNDAIEIYGGRDIIVANNILESIGFHGYTNTPRNGITITGFMELVTTDYSSRSAVVTGNTIRDIKDAGIAYSAFKGLVIDGNTIIGATHFGIEGNTAFSTTHVEADYSQEIPADTIITNNYIDGNNVARSLPKAWNGISGGGGNQGRLLIKGNTIRNVGTTDNSFGSYGINVTAQANGAAIIEGNYLEGIALHANSHAIYAKSEYVSIKNNVMRDLSITAGTNATAITVQSASKLFVHDNEADGGLTNFVYADGTTATIVSVRDNTCLGTVSDFFQDAYSGLADQIIVEGNKGFSLISGAGTRGFYRATNAAHTITDLTVEGNKGTWSNAPSKPINLGTMSVGAVGRASIKNNDWGAVTGSGSCLDAASRVTDLIEHSNEMPGQRRRRVTAVPTTGTWAVGDEFFHSDAASGEPSGWRCTTAGDLATTGVVKAMANLA